MTVIREIGSFIFRKLLLRTSYACLKYVLNVSSSYCAGGKIEKNEMGGACGAYGGGERCAQGFGGEA